LPGEARAGASRKILVAEDNPVNQVVAARLLERRGHRVTVAANGREAVAAVERERFDLVLMDVQMPEMDGFEATHRIRRPESAVLSHDIPVVAMTAHAMAGDRESCLEAGMDDYVSKPIDPRVLAEVIARWLSATPTSRPRPTPIRPVAAEPPADQTDVPTYDHDGVLERLMGDESLVREVISMFLEDTPRQMDALARALQAGDATAVRRLAHTVKGAAGNVGAQVVQAAALRLEQASESGDMKETGAARTALEQAMLEFSRLVLVDGGMAP
jgi:CheY-like chemotaxis protein/HPt (histidine-containing phosphotransfer) domain-containing protein